MSVTVSYCFGLLCANYNPNNNLKQATKQFGSLKNTKFRLSELIIINFSLYCVQKYINFLQHFVVILNCTYNRNTFPQSWITQNTNEIH